MSTTPPASPGRAADETPALVTSAKAPAAIEKVIDLPTGKELDDLTASKLQSAKEVRVMVIAGRVGAGKTTLLNALHDLFQEGKIGDYSFAGSKTLPAFEQRCHFSRTASDRAAQNTERTKLGLGDVRYLHIQVSGPNLRTNPLDLLFTDVSGEMFERACDSISECKQLHFLQTADRFVLLIDCEKLTDLKVRNKTKNDAMKLLRSCLDSGMLASSCFVNVVWARYDWIMATGNAQDTAFLDKATEDFTKEFGSRVGALSFTKVAARPEKGEIEFGYGVSDLLKGWLNSSSRDRKMNIVPDDQEGSRESEKFSGRYFKAVQEPQ